MTGVGCFCFACCILCASFCVRTDDLRPLMTSCDTLTLLRVGSLALTMCCTAAIFAVVAEDFYDTYCILW